MIDGIASACVTEMTDLSPNFDKNLVQNDITWEEFVNDLGDACEPVFPSKTREYNEVYALLPKWKEDDLGSETEILELEQVFSHDLNYSTELWKIPTKYSEKSLERKLSEVKSLMGEKHGFIIVYYRGHGAYDVYGQSVWQGYVAFQ